MFISKLGEGEKGEGGGCVRNLTSNGNSAFNSAFVLGRGNPRKGNRVGRPQNLVAHWRLASSPTFKCANPTSGL